MTIPLKNAYITNPYENILSDGTFHKGLDMISSSGDRNVVAVKSGTVSFVGYDAKGFGNYVSIEQEDGLRVLYCHLQSYQVRVGQSILEGETIGIEGTTGNTTGIHLHLEVRTAPYRIGEHINPANYLGIRNKRGAIEFINNWESDDIMLNNLIEEFGESVVYSALRNLCEKEKNKNIVPEWAKEEFESAIEAGITDGTRPQSLATRVETAVMIERANNSEEEKNSESINE